MTNDPVIELLSGLERPIAPSAEFTATLLAAIDVALAADGRAPASWRSLSDPTEPDLAAQTESDDYVSSVSHEVSPVLTFHGPRATRPIRLLFLGAAAAIAAVAIAVYAQSPATHVKTKPGTQRPAPVSVPAPTTTPGTGLDLATTQYLQTISTDYAVMAHSGNQFFAACQLATTIRFPACQAAAATALADAQNYGAQLGQLQPPSALAGVHRQLQASTAAMVAAIQRAIPASAAQDEKATRSAAGDWGIAGQASCDAAHQFNGLAPRADALPIFAFCAKG